MHGIEGVANLGINLYNKRHPEKLVEPFEISIDGTQESYYYQLYDEKEEVYEIEVPNTGIHSTSSYLSFIIIGLGYYYVQKKYC